MMTNYPLLWDGNGGHRETQAADIDIASLFFKLASFRHTFRPFKLVLHWREQDLANEEAAGSEGVQLYSSGLTCQVHARFMSGQGPRRQDVVPPCAAGGRGRRGHVWNCTTWVSRRPGFAALPGPRQACLIAV